MALIKFIKGKKSSTDVATLDANTLYFFEDTQEFYKGKERFGVGDLSAITNDLSRLEGVLDSTREDVDEILESALTSESQLNANNITGIISLNNLPDDSIIFTISNEELQVNL